MIQVFVPGVPQPQGSKNAYVRGNRAVLVEANKKLPNWRKQLTEKLETANAGCEPLEGALKLEVIFLMPKAKSNKKNFPYQKPDLDKLVRAVGDSATAAGVINDDSQIVQILAWKLWAEDEPGAVISLSKFLGESD